MQQKIFSVPAFGGDLLNEELNRFIRGHKVINVQKHFVQTVESCFWTFCIQFIEGTVAQNENFKREKIDYSKELPPEKLEIFNSLRKLRKKMADDANIPAYAVFTDEELSKIALLENINKQGISNITGIGKNKLEKYGIPLIEQYLRNEK